MEFIRLCNTMEKSLSVLPFLKLTLPPLGRAGVGISLFGLSLSSPFHTDLP